MKPLFRAAMAALVYGVTLFAQSVHNGDLAILGNFSAANAASSKPVPVVSSDPSGTCTNASAIELSSASSNIFACLSGAWQVIGANLSGNAVLTTGFYSDPAWLTHLAASKLTGTVPAGNLPVGNSTSPGILQVGTGLAATGGSVIVTYGTGANQALQGSTLGQANGPAQLNPSGFVVGSELPTATTSTLGLSAAGTGLTATGGVLAVAYGTTAGTAVQGSTVGRANGVASLDSSGLVPVAQLPSSSTLSTPYDFTSAAGNTVWEIETTASTAATATLMLKTGARQWQWQTWNSANGGILPGALALNNSTSANIPAFFDGNGAVYLGGSTITTGTGAINTPALSITPSAINAIPSITVKNTATTAFNGLEADNDAGYGLQMACAGSTATGTYPTGATVSPVANSCYWFDRKNSAMIARVASSGVEFMPSAPVTIDGNFVTTGTAAISSPAATLSNQLTVTGNSTTNYTNLAFVNDNASQQYQFGLQNSANSTGLVGAINKLFLRSINSGSPGTKIIYTFDPATSVFDFPSGVTLTVDGPINLNGTCTGTGCASGTTLTTPYDFTSAAGNTLWEIETTATSAASASMMLKTPVRSWQLQTWNAANGGILPGILAFGTSGTYPMFMDATGDVYLGGATVNNGGTGALGTPTVSVTPTGATITNLTVSGACTGCGSASFTGGSVSGSATTFTPPSTVTTNQLTVTGNSAANYTNLALINDNGSEQYQFGLQNSANSVGIAGAINKLFLRSINTGTPGTKMVYTFDPATSVFDFPSGVTLTVDGPINLNGTCTGTGCSSGSAFTGGTVSGSAALFSPPSTTVSNQLMVTGNSSSNYTNLAFINDNSSQQYQFGTQNSANSAGLTGSVNSLFLRSISSANGNKLLYIYNPATSDFSFQSGAIVQFLGGISTGSTSSNKDLAGVLTLSGGAATYTFTGTYTAAPICVASSRTANPAYVSAISTTAFTVTGTGTDSVSYVCVGRN